MADDRDELPAKDAENLTVDRLRAREALLSEAEHLVRVGSFVWEPGASVLWSDEFYRMLGCGPRAIAPDPELFFSAVHPDDLARVRAAAAVAADSGELPEIVYRIIRHDNGETRFLRGSGHVYRKPDGSVHRIVGALLDVTESRRAALALEQAVALSRAAEELASSGSFVVRLSPFELTLSDGLRRLTGLPERNIGAAAGVRLIHPDDLARVREWWLRLVETRNPSGIQFRMFRDGETRHVDLRATVMPFLADGGDRVVGAAIDVTERVQLEGDLQRAAKFEAVGTLAAGVAHDFNNYLMVVSAALEHLPHSQLDTQARLISNARYAISRCAELTRQLLGFARCQPFAPRLIDVREVIEAMHDLFRQSVGRRAQLRIQNATRPLYARLDAQQLEQILANLIVNAADAIEATRCGLGEVRIVTDEVVLASPLASVPDPVPAGTFTRICVEDDGGGVAPEHLSRIFEPYFTTKSRGRGTGLGLSAVYGIAHQNGGLVTVEGLDSGTRFALWFAVPPAQPVEAQ